MRLLGEASGGCEVARQITQASREGRPFFAYSDGEDITAVVADEGDSAESLLRVVQRHVPEFAT